MQDRIRLVLAGLALAVGVACGEGTGPADQGSFTGTVTGDLTLALNGTAVFGIASQGGSQGFVIALDQKGATQFDRDVIVLGRFNTQRPEVGTYVVIPAACTMCSPDDFDGGYVFQRASGESGFFVSETGAVQVTASSGDEVVGSVSFTAVVLSGSGTSSATNLTVTAQFRAVPGQIPTVGG
ncbi:MAG: hypothetical protein OEO20_08290 [Gemmatimonadota bacterium]|nr:hypothetical protein [Gemmatimonadota bacterium]MDH3369656.1 hypothetical protein [Gemmatimonadota bacterium]MDH3478286.1 hypothetical protein [Gemmatimonadota bacterium]MDH3570685.1 hypothetical protein [Gemmatimonadota bacterium]MDH5550193.1 hypothetical protein [Gemmatimonadota bacterium]